MNAVYVYRREGIEVIKYSIRSLVKHYNPDKIYIAGDYPEGMKCDGFMNIDRLPTRYADSNNILASFIGESFDDEILIMHDDIFLTEPYKPVMYYDGYLEDRAKGTEGERRTVFDNTIPYLDGGAKNYALHCPMPTDVSMAKHVFNTIPQPFSWMNMLGNKNKRFKRLEGKDHKYKSDATPSKLPPVCFSTYAEDESFIELLEQLYPKQTKYEL